MESNGKEGLISIGKMAEANRVSIATLRLYDNMGLLKPVYTDPDSGYRYYDMGSIKHADVTAHEIYTGLRYVF